MMREKLYGIFLNIDDAKSASGKIKKESFNQTDLTIIIPILDLNQTNDQKNDVEFAKELVGDHFQQNHSVDWPGMQEDYLAGVGKVQIGSSLPSLAQNDNLSPKYRIEEEDMGVIQTEILAKKIVTIVKVEPELLPQIRLIMESCGADLL